MSLIYHETSALATVTKIVVVNVPVPIRFNYENKSDKNYL